MSRTLRIIIRCSLKEKQRIHARAAKHRLKASKFLRQCGLRGSVLPPTQAVNIDQWRRLAGALSNFNQLIRLCHSGAVPKNLGPVAEECMDLIHEVRRRLIRKRRDK
jgi:hypothetical protein